jgi:hypothetical protein
VRGKQTLGALFQTVTRLPGRVAKAGGQDDCAEVGEECKAECGEGGAQFQIIRLIRTEV